jgi:hypothetical protein
VAAFLDVAYFAVRYWLGEEEIEGEDKGRMGYGVFDPVKRQQLTYEQTRLLITRCPTSRRLTSLDRVYFVSVTRLTDSRLRDPSTRFYF